MSLKARLLRWWDAMLGRPPWYRDSNVTISRTNLYSDAPPAKKTPVDTDGLSLADDDESGRQRRRRSAGINPYANDAGFAKPQGWDRKERD